MKTIFEINTITGLRYIDTGAGQLHREMSAVTVLIF